MTWDRLILWSLIFLHAGLKQISVSLNLVHMYKVFFRTFIHTLSFADDSICWIKRHYQISTTELTIVTSVAMSYGVFFAFRVKNDRWHKDTVDKTKVNKILSLLIFSPFANFPFHFFFFCWWFIVMEGNNEATSYNDDCIFFVLPQKKSIPRYFGSVV